VDNTTIIRKPVKRMTLRVHPDGEVILTAPPGTDTTAFLTQQHAWIQKQRARFETITQDFGEGAEELFLYNGTLCYLTPAGCCTIHEEEREITYTSPKALISHLKQTLYRDLREQIARFEEESGTPAGRVTIKMQKTKWGSCSSKGNLNFNLRCIALPPELREYIVIHECAHLKELHHGKKFWELVEQHYPTYREAEAALRRYWVVIERNRPWQVLTGAK
jgi:hypothetical protein